MRRRSGGEMDTPWRRSRRTGVSSSRSARDEQCHEKEQPRHERFQGLRLSQKKLDDGTDSKAIHIPPSSHHELTLSCIRSWEITHNFVAGRPPECDILSVHDNVEHWTRGGARGDLQT